MTEQVTKLSLAVDSTQVTKADAELDKFTASAKAAEGAAKGLEAGSRGTGAAMAGIASGASKAATAQAAFARQTAQAGAATKLSAMQAQQLGFQLNDLFVQIASGGNPLTALIQQGSQLNGTFGSTGATLRAIGTVFTATRVIVGGLALAGVGLAAAFASGEQQSVNLRRAVVLTGNAAGVTEGQFNAMAESIAKSTNTTIGSARETLQGLIASGRFSGEALKQAAAGVQTLSKATGQASDEIVRDFIRAADGPSRFAEQTNRSLNFLTAEQLRYIRTLEDQGRTQEALAVTFEALNKRTAEAAANVGTLERAWNGVKNAVSGALDALLAIGRTKTVEDRLRDLRVQLELLNEAQSPEEAAGGGSAALARRAEIEDQIAALENLQAAERSNARTAAEAAEKNQARIAFDRLREQTLSKQARLTKELADANALADKSGATAAERAAVLAGIREKYASLDGDVNALAKAKLQADLDAIEQALRDRNAAVRNAQTVFNALRQAGALDDAEAFAAQRAQIRLQADFEVRALEDENARREKARFSGKEAVRLILDNNARIAANLQEIARIRGDAAAQERALEIQQEAALRRRLANQQAERLSMEQTFESMRRAYDLELALIGIGDLAREKLIARAQIEEKYRADIERATAEIATKRTAGTATADDEREFEARIQLLQEFLRRSLTEWEDYYQRRRAMEQDASLGAAEAFAKYQEEASNTAKLSEGFWTRSLQRTEDALVEFITTGKLNWKSLADSIVAEIVRIIVKQQISNALAAAMGDGGGGGGFFGGILSGIGTLFGGARASGGPVQRGKLYEINERGGPGEILNVGARQYLLAAQNGNVEPNAAGGSVTKNYTINVSMPPGSTKQTAQQAGAEIARRLRVADVRGN